MSACAEEKKENRSFLIYDVLSIYVFISSFAWRPWANKIMIMKN